MSNESGRMVLKFHFRLGFFCLCLFFVIAFCCLGVWQLQRYTIKKAMLNSFDSHIHQSPKPLLSLLSEIPAPSLNTLQFQQVSLDGEYQNNLTMFIQNQFHEQQQGFEVLTPMKLQQNNKLLLVDRGWVYAPNQHQLPMILPVHDLQSIHGYIKLLNEYQYILGENILEPNKQPVVMQKIDLAEISHLTKQAFYPFIIRLNPMSANGYVRDWPIVALLPERHLAYAIQWFALALLVIIAYLGFSCERTYAKKS